ncbi:hypothetical protein CALVIDRAFT_527512 [Calocera viscosa TUFC12733]|uniref:Uncharacterized protein n=1 Tax=Calocera viscosa (strain TUFC12733) TaxID=1330018 RepID=A0A167M8P5_CALVF|nr:hypothetical protein CALVIDRAFT_527512 [Calocera viscosa TUFC12733]
MRDFFTFLAERERAPEALAFVLWYREYERLWAELAEEERGRAEALDPAQEWGEYVRERERMERAVCVLEQPEKWDEEEWDEGAKPWEDISLERMGAGTPFADPLGVHSHSKFHSTSSTSTSTSSKQAKPRVDHATQAALDCETLAIAPWMVDELEVGAQDRARMAEISRQADEELQRTVSFLMRDNLPLRDEVRSLPRGPCSRRLTKPRSSAPYSISSPPPLRTRSAARTSRPSC